MATTKVSELPTITALTDDDILIANDGNVTTSNITFANVISSIEGKNLTFTGTISFAGTTAGIELGDLAAVDLTTPATDGQILAYEASSSSWKPVNNTTTPSLNDVALIGATTDVDISVGNLFTVRGDGATTDGAIKLNCSQNSHGVTVQSPPHASAASYTLTLPDDTGTSGQALLTDGNGALSWGNVSGGSAFTVAPVVTAVDAAAVTQGTIWTAAQTVDQDYPGLAWYFYDYTGTSNTYNTTGTTGVVGGIENTPGNYTIKARAAWPFGISDEVTINVTVNTFTLNQNNLFGGLDGMQGSFDFYPTTASNYIALQGAVVYKNGDYVFDNGVEVADTANCIAFWSFTTDVLVAFRYNQSGVLEFSYKFYNVSALPSQGQLMTGSLSFYTSVSSQDTASNNSSVLGKRMPAAGNYTGGVGSTHFLSITPAGSEFNNFGSDGSDWSYGFVLADDWVSGGTANQMLSPTGSDYIVNTVAAFGFGSTPYEYVHYGNSTSKFSSSSTGTSWDIASDGWMIGNAGELVVVTFNSTTNTWSFYVEGVLKATTTSLSSYMNSTTTVTELRFGDAGGSSATAYPEDYNDIGAWPWRLSNIFVANGTAFTQAQVTEMTADKADLSTSDNYTSFTTFASITGGGIVSVKGAATYARRDISFPNPRAAVYS